MKQTKQTYIALIDQFDQLRAANGYEATPEISITIATLHDDGTPRNFQIDCDTPKRSTGGCRARIWAYKPSDTTNTASCIFSYYGPAVSYGHLRDYQHGAEALKVIEAKRDAMYKVRGGCADAAEDMGRWLEACGISEVFIRVSGDAQWLSHGEYDRWTIGRTVNEIRAKMPKPEAQAQAQAV